jgi:hypothetical protein
MGMVLVGLEPCALCPRSLLYSMNRSVNLNREKKEGEGDTGG